MAPLLTSMHTLAFGFALSGLTASAFEACTTRRASFKLLRAPDLLAVVAVPLVTLAAPYMLARNLAGAPAARRSVAGVTVGTALAGLWSLALGSAALAGVTALGV